MVYSWQVNEIAICAAYVLIYLLYDKHAATAAAAAPGPEPEPKPSGTAAPPAEAAPSAEAVGATISPLLALRSVCRAYHAERALSEVRPCRPS